VINNQVKDLFQLHSELTDAKVDMAVSKAIDRVVEQIRAISTEMYSFRHEMNSELYKLRHDMNSEMFKLRNDMNYAFNSLDNRVIAIETELGIVGEHKKGLYNRFMDYFFKAGYSITTFVTLYMIYLLTQLHLLIK